MFDNLGDLFKSSDMTDDTLRAGILKAVACLGLPLVLTVADHKFHMLTEAHSVMQSIHIYLAMVSIVIYTRATLLIMGYFNKSQALSTSFKVAGWLGAFSHYRGGSVSSYVSRLAIMICFIMVPLNTHHLFTFIHEDAPDIKNIVWRFGHILIAMLLVMVGEEYRRYVLKSSQGQK